MTTAKSPRQPAGPISRERVEGRLRAVCRWPHQVLIRAAVFAVLGGGLFASGLGIPPISTAVAAAHWRGGDGGHGGPSARGAHNYAGGMRNTPHAQGSGGGRHLAERNNHFGHGRDHDSHRTDAGVSGVQRRSPSTVRSNPRG